jgi:L-threonylcarbamoyladenylate synthase
MSESTKTSVSTALLDAEDLNAVEDAAAIVRRGGIVVLPTDTVYGVGASLDHPAALDRIFACKGRPLDQTLPVLLGSFYSLERVAAEPTPSVQRLMEYYWPGALTIVVPAKAGLPRAVVGPGETVGVRVPADRSARALIDLTGGALAVTSANRSGEPPALDAESAHRFLGGSVDAILDGGPMIGTTASTVVRTTGTTLEVLRAGSIDPDEIQRVWAGEAD